MCVWKVGVAIKRFELMKACCQPSNVSLQDLMSEITDDYMGLILFSTLLWGYIDLLCVSVCMCACIYCPYILVGAKLPL